MFEYFSIILKNRHTSIGVIKCGLLKIYNLLGKFCCFHDDSSLNVNVEFGGVSLRYPLHVAFLLNVTSINSWNISFVKTIFVRCTTLQSTIYSTFSIYFFNYF